MDAGTVDRRQDWGPVSVATMRHILEQVHGECDLPAATLADIAEHFRVPSPPIVHFATQRRRIGAIHLVLMTVSAMRVSGAEIPRQRDLVHLGFVLGGAVVITPHGGEPTRLGPGSSCVIGDWANFDAESTHGTRGLNILVPAATLADRGVHISAARFGLDGARSLRSPLRGFALSIVDASWRASAVGELVAERAIEDLVVGMFLEVDGYAMDSEDLRAGLRGRALSMIAASHRSTDLCPSLVADHLRVSLRHLQRAFEHSGDSVAHAIARRRVESAALLLLAPGAEDLTVPEIAHGAGFRSAFELRTAFRDHYGVLPSEYRRGSAVRRNHAPQQH